LQQLVDQAFGTGLAVHVGLQVGKLGARLEQPAERLDLAGHGGRREVIDALEGDVDHELALARQRVGHGEGHARLDRLHAFVEVVDVDVEELAVGHRRQCLGGLAGQIGKNTHDERQLDLFLRAVDFHVVFDLHAWRPVAGDEFLAAVVVCHENSLMEN
jgi:hypothetical protein